MRRLLVRDLMTTDVRSVQRTTPVGDLARILGEGHISGVPVLDEERTVVGVVSESDLLDKEVPPGRWSLPRRRARAAPRSRRS